MSKNDPKPEACVSKRTALLLVNTVKTQPEKPFKTHLKIIGYGKYFDVYEFTRPISINHQNVAQRKLNILSDDEIYDCLVNPELHTRGNRSKEYKLRNINRAKNRIRRLVQANFDTKGKFLTFHFRNTNDFSIYSLTECHKRFYGFMRRLKRKYPGFKYVAVPEFQKRGAVHYHLMVNMPYIPWKELMALWKYGGVYITKIDNPAAVGAYISKYVSKALNDERYQGHRCFYTSNNLIQPSVRYGDQYMAKINLIESNGYKPAFESSYHSDWCGEIKFKSYNLYQTPAQKEKDGQS